MPERRHCSVGRREGPSMAQRGYPGIHAGMPTAQCLRSASVVYGAPRSRSKSRSKAKQSKAKQSKAKQSKAKQSKAKQEWGISSIYVAGLPLSRASSLPHRGVGVHSICTRHKNCGSELARDEASPFKSSSTVTSPSRASPLPQEERVHAKPGRL